MMMDDPRKPRSEGDVLVLGLSQPLLDITVQVPSSLLQQLGVQEDSAARDPHLLVRLLQEVRSLGLQEVQSLGGATTNSLRVAASLLGRGKVGALGCLGIDSAAAEYRRLLASEGIVSLSSSAPGLPTGRCLVLVTPNGSRSLITDLGAAASFPTELLLTPKVQHCLAQAQVIYLAGFSLSLGSQVVTTFLRASLPARLLLNLSAELVCRKYRAEVLSAAAQAAVVLGNRAELAALFPGVQDLEQQAASLTALFTSPHQTLVVTAGPSPILVSRQTYLSYLPVPPIPEAAIVNTNGAGDAVAGALLAALALGRRVEEGVEWGLTASRLVLSQEGAVLPQGCSLAAACGL